jgi:D-sedoheptulose 7-phosphate isomerase
MGKLANHLSESVDVLQSARKAWTDTLAIGALNAMIGALRSGKSVLVCGNGGSAADAMHLTTELVGRFLLDRQALNVICLSSNAAVLSACANDHGFETVFSRQVEAYGQPGAVLIGISTSGTSPNIIAAFEQARAMEMTTIALTGEGGGELAGLADYLFAVPSRSTPLIQQAHVCLYHYLCQAIEQEFAAHPLQREMAAPAR